MTFTIFQFWAVFLPLVFLLFWTLKKWPLCQSLLLFIANIFFYSCYDMKYVLLLFLSIFITWIGGILGNKYSKNIYLVTLGCNILILLIFKYTGFVLGNINLLLQQMGGASITIPSLLLPVGLSFFIFQSSSYLLDLYNGKINVEKNIIVYGIFVSFFPTIVSGPIQKSREMLPKLRSVKNLTYTRFQSAIIIFLWGFFQKTVVADRIAIFTNQIFDNYTLYEGTTLFLAAILYSLQIYTDFQGYSCMAIGVAKLFGLDLSENFKQPYLATSISDFWRRWHISLTSWFREYIYFPLGGNRKGTLKKYRNVLTIFLISGLWHGAAWTFIIWGGIHAVYQIIGALTLRYRVKICKKLNIDRNTFSYKLWQRICVFFLITIAWIFFRASSLSMALEYIRLMFTSWNPWILFDGSLSTLGISWQEGYIYIFMLAVILIVSILKESGRSVKNVLSQNALFRGLIPMGLILVIIIWGIYGPEFSSSSFIYAGF